MQRLGLNSQGAFAAYLNALVNTHQRRIRLQVLTREGKLIRSLTPYILDGQVSVDSKQKDRATRTCTMQILDPTNSLGFEADGLADMPLHQKRMIRVGYEIFVDALGEWVNCWVFTGPIADLKRTGAVVELTAYGKEAMMLGTTWIPRQFKKGVKKTRVIKELFRDAGETRMSIPDLPAKLPAIFTVKKLDTRWAKAKKLAASMDRQLFYDGRGVAILRHRPNKPVYAFDAALLSDPEIGRPGEDFTNIWTVHGRKPKGAKKRVSASVTLPKAHSLSPHSLARGGKLFYRGEVETNDAIRTKAEATARAKRMRDDGARLEVQFGFDALPIPILDEGDLVRVRTRQDVWLVRMQQFTIPLGIESEATMTVGAIKRSTAAVKRRKKTRKVGDGVSLVRRPPRVPAWSEQATRGWRG